MFSFRVNLSTNEVEILVNGYVEYAMPKADFPQFAFLAWKEAKTPSKMKRVRNLFNYTIK